MNAGAEQGFGNPGLSIGGTVPQPIDRRVVTKSTIYKAIASGTLVIRAVGATGSPGLAHTTGCATGAGAGEVVDKAHPVSAGDDIIITIGSGGAAVTRTTSGQTNGNDGSDTTITGPNSLNVVIKAGKAGKAAALSAGTPLAGGDGGQGGFGGDTHRPGGRGGNITNCAVIQVTGGGAPNLTTTQTQTATRGGDVPVLPGSLVATGGGSPGGRGADFTSAGGNGATAGGGMGGDATDGGDAVAGKCGPNVLGQRSATAVTLINAAGAPFGLDLQGNGADASNAAGNGGGGVGMIATGTFAGTSPGAFGGFGGLINQSAGQVGSTTLPFYGAPAGQLGVGTSTTLKGCDAVVFLALFPAAV